jgi:hypothetical protein
LPAPRWRLRVQFRTSLLEGFAPTIPDWANDQHTPAGKKLGRGLDHFRKEGAKPVPPPTGDDPYEDEAYRLWQIKQQRR